MNRYQLMTLVALLALVAALPIYALFEPTRLETAASIQEQYFLADAAVTYVANCVKCHGRLGEGVGVMPPLNNPALASADRAVLFDTIAHPPHGTAMSSWHVDAGGALNTYEVQALVTLIQDGDWVPAAALANRQGVVVSVPEASQADLTTMEGISDDPHECRACHEEPAMHAERFGINCSRCHTLDAWTPAYLTRHTFLLDHGDEGKVACETCHTETYAAYTCYGCHDHQPDDMRIAHEREEITRLEPCGECHPTGAAEEAAALGYGVSGGHRAILAEPVLGEPIPDLGAPEDDPRDVRGRR